MKDIIPFGNAPLFRYLFGWMVPPKVSLLKLTQGQTVKELYEKNHFIQDMLVPMETLKDALTCFEKEVKVCWKRERRAAITIVPILIRPAFFRFTPSGSARSSSRRTPACSALAITGRKRCLWTLARTESPKWATSIPFKPLGGWRASSGASKGSWTRKDLKHEPDLDSFSFDSFQMLYADSYMTEAEFRSMFDHTLYDQMRRKYQCEEAFPTVYGKVNRQARD